MRLKVYILGKELWENIQFKYQAYNGKKINNIQSNIKIDCQDFFGILKKMNRKII
jgi:hypothetical protein